MAIVALKKLTFCGLSAEKPQVLAQLQKLGGAHLIALKKIPERDASEQADNAHKALKYLNLCANKRHQLNNAELFDFDKVVNEVLAIQLNSRLQTDRHDALRKRIQEIEPWGDFRLPEDGLLKLWFYIVPERRMPEMQTVDLVWQVVHKDNLNSYVVVIADQEPPLSSMPVARTHTGKIPLSGLKNELNHVELALEDLQAQRESLTRWIGLIAANLAEAEDKSDLNIAHAITLDEDGVFIIQAWVPENNLAGFEQFAADHQMAIVCEEPKVTDKPPTLFKNPEPLAGGEDLVNFYQTPGYFAWGPSGVVFFSFAIFFAMILSDAGYAGIFALLLGIKWRSLGSLCLLLFSSKHVIIKPVNWLLRILYGLKSLSGVAGLFGDVLSYMRLFALGLASASLALTFNRLAEQVYHAVPGIGLLFSLLIFIAGHTLNLLLCLMSCVVHGLRLNFIEFYNWSISDEGYPFKAFSKKGV